MSFKLVRSSRGGGPFRVLDRGYPPAVESQNANILESVHQFAEEFIRTMYRVFMFQGYAGLSSARYPTGLSTEQQKKWAEKGRTLIRRLVQKFKNSPSRYEEATETSTLDKGKLIRFCVRNPKTGQTYDSDTLKFVFMHELAHIVTLDIGHDSPTFWSNFKFLLIFAATMGMYTPVPYDHNSVYCGVAINSNPYFQPEINALL